MEIKKIEPTYTVTLEKDEADAILIQVGARLDELKSIQKKEALKGDVKRVLEMEEFMKSIIKGKAKLEKVRYA